GLAAALAAEHIAPADVRLKGRVVRVGAKDVPLEPESGRTLLNFHGPFQQISGDTTYPVFSFFDVLLSEDRVESGATPPIDLENFRDKIVFVGTSADGLSDIWKSPFSGGGM